MRTRPKKKAEQTAGADDLGALLTECGGFGFPVAALLDERRAAKFLYWSFWRLTDIAKLLKQPEGTIASWKSRDKWDEASPLEQMEGVTHARYIALTMKAQKTGLDFKEIDALLRAAERLARLRRYSVEGGNETDLNPKVANRNAGPKKKPQKNRITPDQVEILKATMLKRMFGYQLTWWSKADLRSRMILKSRQIGATYYFALEALIKALETGHNQIFLSASKAQAHVFRGYIRAFVLEVIGVELSGDPILIDRGEDEDGTPLEQPNLIFLGTNARTAQGYHGDFYFDEFFWVFGFETLKKVASGMAMQKKYRKTYFSTPSSVMHEAYAFWTGLEWNKKRAKDKRRDFDVTWAATKDGQMGADRIWRHMVTIEDAEAQGCDLFDIEDLRDEYSGPEFDNLLMCGFVDDTLSVFPMTSLTPCMVDGEDAWDDVDMARITLGAGRAYSGEVWLSYDPNGNGENADAAGLVVVAPPARPGGKFRVLERQQFKGSDFTEQAEVIRAYTQRYRVSKIDIDGTGIGAAVAQLVRTFFPNLTEHRYDPILKTQMVYKALDVIGKHRLEYHVEFRDLTGALMSIRRTTTASGRQVTYEASRTKDSGHADLAWALFQALFNEPLAAGIGGAARSSVEISR
ncbi:terminase [Brevundimonas intermedia]|uniref:Terminase n=1 Tax=Brevundimonas intermedia TaxID=74315 RepID=A0ABQ5TA04_9CAUL|nr:terminase family protein [Brevundimonas intermedia]GLK49629.1 terminase [Brevundimonas intermedia]